jgi:hypothetical protein
MGGCVLLVERCQKSCIMVSEQGEALCRLIEAQWKGRGTCQTSAFWEVVFVCTKEMVVKLRMVNVVSRRTESHIVLDRSSKPS